MAIANIKKALLIRTNAAIQNKSLGDICRKCRVHRSVFNRVINGERKSKRIDKIIAEELGLNVKTMEEVS